MVKEFTVNSFLKFCVYITFILAILSQSTLSQSVVDEKQDNFNKQIFLALSNANYSLASLDLTNKKPMSLAIDPERLAYANRNTSILDSIDYNYEPWDSKKRFGTAVIEMAVLEFIPWALARWGRTWEDPADDWSRGSPETWWRNISYGWEYDGDNFETNFFAHPYHGNLFFNAGRSNGYGFWESSAFALTGSALWEFFGETFRPAFNDWIMTGVDGTNLGEMLFRLSTMVTDNTASGSKRLWSEIFGALISPVRGFNRLVSGDAFHSYPNPEWRRPKEMYFFLEAGARRLDKAGNALGPEGVYEGIFAMELHYGNPFRTNAPFSFFKLNLTIATGEPNLTRLDSDAFLFGYKLKKTESVEHRFDIYLDYNYNNIFQFVPEEIDTVAYGGILFGSTTVYPHLLSRFKIGEKTDIITQVGVNAILMGATPNDYYSDVEGRNYDFGPGVGVRLVAALKTGHWEYLKFYYYSAWIFTMSEPADSRHHIHVLEASTSLPLTDYFAVGFGAMIYWRNSFYDELPDVFEEHPLVRIFFETALN